VLDCEVVGKSILTTAPLSFKLRTCNQAAVTNAVGLARFARKILARWRQASVERVTDTML
jgi:hypothetical protein